MIGRVIHVHGVFHNAYGPDKAWRWKADEAGGGAFLDLGVHLLDLTLGLLGAGAPLGVASRCLRSGRPLPLPLREVEDFTSVRLDFASGAAADLAASWCAHAGVDCVFRLEALGTRGGLDLVNRGGGFYDFELAVRQGRRRTVVARKSEADLAAASLRWTRRLAEGACFDPSAAGSITVAEVVERIYGRGRETPAEAETLRSSEVASSAFISS